MRKILSGSSDIFARIKCSRGLSLFEVMVTIAIISIIFAACCIVLFAGTDNWQTNKVRLELNQELRKSMEWILNDLRQTGSNEATLIGSLPADDTWYNTVSFKKAVGINNGNIVWSNSIQFLLAGTDSNEVHRNGKIIAQSIQSMQFRRQVSTPKIIEVALQAQKDTYKGNTIDTSLDFKIRLRN